MSTLGKPQGRIPLGSVSANGQVTISTEWDQFLIGLNERTGGTSGIQGQPGRVGPPGSIGAPGSAGAAGAMGPSWDESGSDDFWPVPGPTGARGLTGLPGAPGMQGDAGEDAWPMPPGQALPLRAFGQLIINATHAQTISAAWTPVLNYNAALAAPLGVTQDTALGTLFVQQVGTYSVSITGAVPFTPNNAGRSFFLRLFNVTDAAVAAGPVQIFVGRDIEGANIAVSAMFHIVLPGKAIRVELGGGDTFAACNIQDLAFGIQTV